jgi:hypothetical protein
MISLLVAVAVWLLLLLVRYHRYDGWGGSIAPAATIILLAGGILLNGVFGLIASRRGEYPGGAVALCGVVIWFLTVFVTWGLVLPFR